MTTYEASRPERPGHRWAIWAALVLGLLFLGLGAPLALQTQDTATAEHLSAPPAANS